VVIDLPVFPVCLAETGARAPDILLTRRVAGTEHIEARKVERILVE